MNSRIARLRTAWLGLFAMLLVVFAPLVSQSLAAARAATPQAIAAELCSSGAADAHAVSMRMSMHAMQGMQGMDMGGMAGHGRAGDAADLLAACGYCDLLFNHMALPGVPPAAVAPMALLQVTTVPMPTQRYIALGAFPSGRPRAPPAFSRTV